MAEETQTPPTEDLQPHLITTDDLELELAKRERRKGRGWKYILASSIAAAITAWIPSVTSWIDAQTEKTHRELLLDQVLKEKFSNEKAYEKLASNINKHSDKLGELNACLVDLAALKEWRKGVDEKLARRLNIVVPPPEPASMEITLEPDKPAPKLSTRRPQAREDDPKYQELKEALKQKGAF